jgi:hypothetical protein
MANVARVNGFRPVRYLNGAPYNGAVTRYFVGAADTTALFEGDLVKLGTATTSPIGMRSVTRAAAGDALVGAIVGFEVDTSVLDTPTYRPASTERTVLVADDPNILFVAQENGDTTPLKLADAGLNVNFVVAAGSTSTGRSGMQIASPTVTTTATMSLKLIEPLQAVDNELVANGQANTRWVVKINNHQLGAGTGTAGV